MVIQIFVSVIALFMIGRTWRGLRANAISFGAWMCWSLVWFVAVILVWQPAIADRLAALLQVGRGTDAVLYLALLVGAYLFFKMYVAMERLRMEVTSLTRDYALLEREQRRMRDTDVK